MQINKVLLGIALKRALAACAQRVNEERDEPGKAISPPDLKGAPPNPARQTKAQRKATKRERRTKAAT